MRSFALTDLSHLSSVVRVFPFELLVPELDPRAPLIPHPSTLLLERFILHPSSFILFEPPPGK